jgi:hypothetical protein
MPVQAPLLRPLPPLSSRPADLPLPLPLLAVLRRLQSHRDRHQRRLLPRDRRLRRQSVAAGSAGLPLLRPARPQLLRSLPARLPRRRSLLEQVLRR